MTIEDALRTLGPDAIRAACAAAIKTAHPDTGGTDEDGARIGMIQEARDCLLCFLKETSEPAKIACTNCRGTGSFQQGFGALRCQACNGTGFKS